ncbi:MAG TPA: ABC transporter substrate-binding protein [Gemmatimonadales bacterium]|nr:ABC transporter substrate-binding protein [Gemmatimonadales bacterium]
MPATRLACVAVLLLLCPGCRHRTPVAIGDGVSRAHGTPSIIDVVREALDSAYPGLSIQIDPWSMGNDEPLDAASEQAERFSAKSRLIGVVGHAGSRDALLASVVYNRAGVPQLVPNATSRRLSTAGRWTFPLVPHDGVEGAALVSYALDTLRLRRVTVMYLGDEYGSGLRDGVEAALRARGQAPVDQVMVPSAPCATPRDTLQTSLITRASLHRARPEVVILAVATGSAICLTRLIEAASPGLWYLGADGVDPSEPQLQRLPGAIRERFRTVVFWRPGADSATRRFLRRAHRILGRDPSAAEALSYDGFVMLAAAAQATDGSREAVRRWLEELGRARPPWPGITGPVQFAEPRRGLIRLQAIPGTP